MSATERMVMDLLGGGERFGLELIDASEGRLKRGTAYVTLSRMEQKGFVTSRQEALPPGGIGLPRRMYTATAFGLKVLDAYRALHQTLALNPAEAK